MSVTTLVEELYSIEITVRMLAIRSLGEIGAGAAVAIPDLLGLVDDADKDIAALSLRALAIIGPNESLKPKVSKLSWILVRECARWRHLQSAQWARLGEMSFQHSQP